MRIQFQSMTQRKFEGYTMSAQVDTETNEDLITRIQEQGDRRAFQALYDRYIGIVIGLSYKIVGNRELAEEIAQETFWRVWHNAESYRQQRGSFATWMFRIARNLSIDALRRGGKVELHPLGEDDGDSETPQAVLASDYNVAEETWLRARQGIVKEALEGLPPEQKDVVIWTFFEGKTRREIAATFDIPLGTVNTRARLAINKLREALLDIGFEE